MIKYFGYTCIPVYVTYITEYKLLYCCTLKMLYTFALEIKVMKKIFEIDSVTTYNNMMGIETLNPLISVFNFEDVKEPDEHLKKKATEYDKVQLNMYTIFLKDLKCGNITYGLNTYDYEEGSLIFMSPGQVFNINHNDKPFIDSTGYAIIFHHDLLKNTVLAKEINDYTFFSYEVSEALHLSAREREVILTCINNIHYELEHSVDNHTKTLIISYLELFLNYCKRFYERQFNTRSHVNKDVLTRFEKILSDYFQSDKPLEAGLPSVTYCAEKLFISPNYLGDLMKKETGKSAQDHIKLKILELAKNRIFNSQKSIGEIAYELGFKHPQHFTRMFKKEIGVSPSEFRNLN